MMLMPLLRKMIPPHWRPYGVLSHQTWKHTGGKVVAGPFAGMRYIRSSHGSVYIPKLLGIYEKELAFCVESACALTPDRIIDMGAAEGYYAVGLALRNPHAQVIAFEMDAAARASLTEMVNLNGVETRVKIREKAEPAALQALLDRTVRPLVVCDVEGYELALLDPVAVPALRGAHILVELHDFIHQGVTEIITQRFVSTHRLTHIQSERRDRSELPYSSAYTRLLPEYFLEQAVNERSGRMSWLWMEPLN